MNEEYLKRVQRVLRKVGMEHVLVGLIDVVSFSKEPYEQALKKNLQKALDDYRDRYGKQK